MAERENHKVMRDWARALVVHTAKKCLFFKSPEVWKNIR